jgi:predicted PurR-regulated permease PerM
VTARESTRSALITVGLAVALITLWALRDIVVLVSMAVLLAFVLAPAVALIQRVPLPRGARVSRGMAAAIVVIGLVVVVIWALSLGVPRMAVEAGRIAERIPGTVQMLLAESSDYAARHGLSAHVDPVIQNLRRDAASHLETLGLEAVKWLGKLFGNLGQILHLLLLPVLAFYLLAQSEAVRESMLRFLPPEVHGWLAPGQRAVDRALTSYVRGQAMVCLIMGVAVGTTLAIAGYPGATVLGVIVGIAEIVPFLGFGIALGAIVLIGLGVSPGLAFAGFLIYIAFNTINSYLILPRVMSQHLKMHPFVIMVSVLAGATLLGPVGVFIALPGAAVVQGLIEEFAGKRKGDPHRAA